MSSDTQWCRSCAHAAHRQPVPAELAAEYVMWGVLQVPLQAVDLSHVSILYTQGDMAAITPIYDYNFQVGLHSEHS